MEGIAYPHLAQQVQSLKPHNLKSITLLCWVLMLPEADPPGAVGTPPPRVLLPAAVVHLNLPVAVASAVANLTVDSVALSSGLAEHHASALVLLAGAHNLDSAGVVAMRTLVASAPCFGHMEPVASSGQAWAATLVAWRAALVVQALHTACPAQAWDAAWASAAFLAAAWLALYLVAQELEQHMA